MTAEKAKQLLKKEFNIEEDELRIALDGKTDDESIVKLYESMKKAELGSVAEDPADDGSPTDDFKLNSVQRKELADTLRDDRDRERRQKDLEETIATEAAQQNIPEADRPTKQEVDSALQDLGIQKRVVRAKRSK